MLIFLKKNNTLHHYMLTKIFKWNKITKLFLYIIFKKSK